MNSTSLCAAIRDGLPALFECTPAPREGVRVRTPMMYPDGGIVDIFVLEREDSYVLTDFGEALAWLRMQTVNPRRTPKQLGLIQDVCQTLGVELRHGQLILRSLSFDELSDGVTRLAQAVVRVSDIWFTMRMRSFESTSDEVNEWLIERDISFDSGVRHRGRSGRDWTIDFQTYTHRQTSLIFLLSTGSRSAANRITDHVVAGCIDLRHPQIHQLHADSVSLVSLFDDTSDVWRDGDFRLASEVSEVALWSQQDRLETILRAR